MKFKDYDNIVSIIMVTWGRLPYTKLCVESLLKLQTGSRKVSMFFPVSPGKRYCRK